MLNINIGRYCIKTDDLFAYSFVCNKEQSIVCAKNNQCCCNIFLVDTSLKKINRIIPIFDVISEFCPDLKNQNEYINPFEKEEKNRYIIDKKENDYCVFSYFDKENSLKCGIHSAALKIGKDPFFYKPLTCSIWPLTIYNKKNNQVELSLDLESKSTCIKKKRKKDNKIDSNLLDILQLVLGKKMKIFNQEIINLLRL